MPSASAAGGSLLGGSSDAAPSAAAAGQPPPPPAVPAAPGYLSYAALGPGALLGDAARGLEAAAGLSAELAALEKRVPAGGGDAGGGFSASQVSLLRQHLALQTELLVWAQEVAAALPGAREAVDGAAAQPAAALAPLADTASGRGAPETPVVAGRHAEVAAAFGGASDGSSRESGPLPAADLLRGEV